MEKRDLEKLGREHKGKFSRTRASLKQESSLVAEINAKEGTRQLPTKLCKGQGRTISFE